MMSRHHWYTTKQNAHGRMTKHSMASNYYKQVAKLISENGFLPLPKSQQPSGSHEMWKNDDGFKVSVPRKIVARHTAQCYSERRWCQHPTISYADLREQA